MAVHHELDGAALRVGGWGRGQSHRKGKAPTKKKTDAEASGDWRGKWRHGRMMRSATCRLSSSASGEGQGPRLRFGTGPDFSWPVPLSSSSASVRSWVQVVPWIVLLNRSPLCQCVRVPLFLGTPFFYIMSVPICNYTQFFH
jgi:hypothetical protein